ncbi:MULTISPECIES: hypothetical protein [unclassified Bacteroides]|jgi:ssDNA-binding Zn-finger/Zn-ribbon topoisomerase 1|uniref:hypothetical protein n=1 Tax=unclassified Bacteroides TaxID=2646097 RepID=UPI000E9AE8FE|nr:MULTISPECIES: hypothetical protein [unclassified Bacteroides]RGN42590.1 hypothetical protein DXB63_16600 [Bacteroides sp. OM05-12]RHR69869.1 hypothetical protein DWW69_18825 [Bacteroides sp. AF16-49]DAQ08336.1 MAG TPA: hypothetical protein [Caudoviricetes sp.]
MIKIKEFREFVADIRGKVNADMENAIAGTIVAVKEEHLIKKLKDKDKLWLCSNFPDADDIVENRDSYNTNNHVLFFLLEKVSSGQQNDEEEAEFYERIQEVMEKVKELIKTDITSCSYSYKAPKNIKTEWEYNIYGGFSGMSIGFDLKDYD